MTKYFVTIDGTYLGGFDGALPPTGSIEVPTPPAHGHDTWNGTTWIAAPPTREKLKAGRQIAVDNIKVTTTAGNTFDGDETSQTRMARAILVLSTGYAATIPWVLADNTTVEVDTAELTEALALAGQAQSALWAI